jgi:hypothetical protein
VLKNEGHAKFLTGTNIGQSQTRKRKRSILAELDLDLDLDLENPRARRVGCYVLALYQSSIQY